jgi:CheY-like chemotaxis protein
MMDILIVEDEQMVQQLYKEILSLKGYNVAGTASSGEEAMEVVGGLKKWPDLIILDHRMPGMSGLDTARVMLETRPGAKIILVSADENAVWEALRMGIVGMKKPFNIGDLLTAIGRAVHKDADVEISTPVRSPPGEVRKGGFYLVPEPDGKKGLERFLGLLSSGYSGLVFSRKHPDALRDAQGLSGVPLVWFTTGQVKYLTCISPQNVQKMLIMVQAIIDATPKAAIYVSGFEYILTNINFDRALNLLQVLHDRVLTAGEAVMLFSMDLTVLGDRERRLVEKEFDHLP